MGGKSSGSSRSVTQQSGNTFIAPFQVPFLNALAEDTARVAGQQLDDFAANVQPLGDEALARGRGSLSAIEEGFLRNPGGLMARIAQMQGSNPADIAQSIQDTAANTVQQQPGASAVSQIAADSGVDASSLTGTAQLMRQGNAGAPFQQRLGTFSPDPSATEMLGGFNPRAGATQRLQNFSRTNGRGLPNVGGIQQQAANLTAGLTQPNPALGGQLSALDAAIQNNLQSTLGTLGNQAALAGATGGARQSLAIGQAGAEAARQFGAGAANLVSQDFATRQQLAPQLMAESVRGQLGAAGLSQQGALTSRAQDLAALQAAQQGQLGASAQQLAGLQAQQQGQLGASAQQLAALQAAQQGGLGAQANQIAALQAAQQGDLSVRQLQQAGQQQQLQAGSTLLSAGLQRDAQRTSALQGVLDTTAGAAAASDELGLQAAQSALGGAEQLFNLGLAPGVAQFAPLFAASSIFGTPTLLQTQSSRTNSRGRNRGFEIGL